MWRDRVYGTSGHVGRVLQHTGKNAGAVRRGKFRVMPVGGLARGLRFGLGRPQLVSVDDVVGWWPKGARDRSPAAMREVSA